MLGDGATLRSLDTNFTSTFFRQMYAAGLDFINLPDRDAPDLRSPPTARRRRDARRRTAAFAATELRQSELARATAALFSDPCVTFVPPGVRTIEIVSLS
ncbi:hypothetical protein HPB50_012800 [Hyalomma asiaticum]|uniref:Uncharacterized protein n=1 Tax=Hyalomma asiaticum TaxID=266040 RepID=A0ACB7SN66_HYAAI|nr:hypothetical protein HPB50_012800 [Hyalomma asiaticum]